MKDTKIFTHPLFVIPAALLCCALWGSATPFIKTGYELLLPDKNIPSTILFAGIRFFIAGIMTIMLYSACRKRVLVPKKENYKRVVIISIESMKKA